MKKCFTTCFKRNKTKIPDVYVLLLENGKYYIGETLDKKKRILNHKQGNGSAWTKQNKVLSEVKPITHKQASFSELNETLERFNLHGIDNVRGSMFTSPYSLRQSDKIMAAQLYCELKGFCRKCGRDDHFVGNCKSTDVAEWVHNFGGKLTTNTNISSRKCANCSKDIQNLPKYFRFCSQCYNEGP